MRVSLGFVSVSPRILFVPPEVDARVNLMQYPRVLLMKPVVDEHMISGGTVGL